SHKFRQLIETLSQYELKQRHHILKAHAVAQKSLSTDFLSLK
ncbi:19007_t:CDS:1, partial [Racocetra persica]